VIVESPAKARKIASYLGAGYVVESSRGHIRDLPRGAADVPAKYKGESWARLGVDVDHAFEPLYIITPDKKSTVTELRNALKGVDELYLATDGDREGADYTRAGRLSADCVADLGLPTDADAYLCGPAAFMSE